jgi:hypothetical protein
MSEPNNKSEDGCFILFLSREERSALQRAIVSYLGELDYTIPASVEDSITITRDAMVLPQVVQKLISGSL